MAASVSNIDTMRAHARVLGYKIIRHGRADDYVIWDWDGPACTSRRYFNSEREAIESALKHSRGEDEALPPY